MTPLAAKLFRETDQPEVREFLAGAQFFECSSLFDLADEMLRADVEAGCNEYSLTAQLPAPHSVVEFIRGDTRLAMLCQQQGDNISWHLFGRWEADLEYLLGCDFTLGTGENGTTEADEDFARALSAESGAPHMQDATQQARGLNGILEKMLCMINQVGLVERKPQPTDKRVLREIAKAMPTPAPAPDTWFQCRIKPGTHGDASVSSGSPRPPMPLHYVRKHFKPSVAKWIDGYWRGDIALGVHRKFYTVQAPAVSAAPS